MENNTAPKLDQAKVDALTAEILKPMETFEKNQSASTDEDLNPEYIKPRMFMFRLQKIMDEYAGGVTAQFTTNKPSLERAQELLAFLAGRLGQTGCFESSRTDALLGERPSDVASRSPRAHRAVP